MPPDAAAVKPFLDPALQYGAAGVLLLILVVILIMLWRRNEKLTDTILTKSASDTAQLTSALGNNTTALNAMAEAQRETNRRMENLDRTLSDLHQRRTNP